LSLSEGGEEAAAAAAAMSKAGAAGGDEEKKPKNVKDGDNEFAFPPGGHAPAQPSMTALLNKYIPHDEVAFKRLIKPSLKAQAQALDVAKVAMAGLDSLIAFLQQKRKTCGDQMEADAAEIQFLNKEIAKKQVMVDRIKAHHAECKRERDIMMNAYGDSITTMKESVHTCMKMTQHTNVNISRLTRTQAPRMHENYLSTGIKEKTALTETNKLRNSTLLSKTGTSKALSKN
jgi:hypothetical protein